MVVRFTPHSVLATTTNPIEFVDKQGVALTAIQALNERFKEQKAELEQKQTEIMALKQRLEKVEQFIKAKQPETQ